MFHGLFHIIVLILMVTQRDLSTYRVKFVIDLQEAFDREQSRMWTWFPSRVRTECCSKLPSNINKMVLHNVPSFFYFEIKSEVVFQDLVRRRIPVLPIRVERILGVLQRYEQELSLFIYFCPCSLPCLCPCSLSCLCPCLCLCPVSVAVLTVYAWTTLDVLQSYE